MNFTPVVDFWQASLLQIIQIHELTANLGTAVLLISGNVSGSRLMKQATVPLGTFIKKITSLNIHRHFVPLF